MKTAIIALVTLISAAGSARAEEAFGELLAAAPGIYAQDLARFSQAVPEPSPAMALAAADKSVKSAPDADYDADKAARLAAIAADRNGYGLKGKCYTWVWKDLMAAGFPYESSVPDPSAYQFAEWARADEARARAFGLKIIPTPDSFEAMPLGAVVVYAQEQQLPYGFANPDHGHIEVMTDIDGVRNGCSDGCWEVAGRGEFLKTEKAKRDVTVLIPVK